MIKQPAHEMIEVEKLTKVFGTKRAVDGISFTVKRGEVLGFPRAERRGQIHHDADAHRLLPAQQRESDGGRL